MSDDIRLRLDSLKIRPHLVFTVQDLLLHIIALHSKPEQKSFFLFPYLKI